MRKLEEKDIPRILHQVWEVDQFLSSPDYSTLLLGFKHGRVRFLKHKERYSSPYVFVGLKASFLFYVRARQWKPTGKDRFFGRCRDIYFLGDSLIRVTDCDPLDLATAIAQSEHYLRTYMTKGYTHD